MLQTISRISVVFLFLMVAQDCITDYQEHVKFIAQPVCLNNSFYSRLFGRFTTVHCTEHQEIADNPYNLSTWLKIAMNVTPVYLLAGSLAICFILRLLRL